MIGVLLLDERVYGTAFSGLGVVFEVGIKGDVEL